MSDPTNAVPVRMLSDVLREELDGRLGPDPAERTHAQENQRLKEMFAEIHAGPPRAALCFSGGGIRSASFGLGVLQGIAKAGLLGSFDYLSTVSGGGYLGGWLSAWIHREHKSPAELENVALSDAAREKVFEKLHTPADTKPAAPEWPAIHFLRAFSNYLSPKLGLLSADTWTLAATFLRNMLLNWLVLIPLLLALLMVPRVFMAAVVSAPPQGWITAAWCIAAALLGTSTAYATLDMPSGGSGQRSETKFLYFRLIPIVLGAFAVVLAWAWKYNASVTWDLPVNELIPAADADFRNLIDLPDFVSIKAALSPPDFSALLFLFGVPAVIGLLAGIIGRRHDAPKIPAMKVLVRTGVMLFCTVLGALAVQWIAGRWFAEPTRETTLFHYVCYAPSVVLAIFLLSNFLLAGLSSWVTEDEDREWWGRSSGWILLSALALAIQGTLVFWGTYWLQILQIKAQSMETVVGWLSGVGGVSGVLTALRGFGSSTTAKEPNASSSNSILHLTAIVFLLVVDVLLAFLADQLAGNVYALTFFAPNGDFNRYALTPWALTFGFIASGVLMGWFINVNKFSLHTMYRNRLIRCFLGASRQPQPRAPHPFTGFDPRDNLEMKDLVPGKPMHIVNIALNIVATKNLAWQERKARSFTVSRLHAGAPGLGYQPSTTYSDGISLGTAVTISGAAASPNMGYHSSPLIALIMTLFNVRLGWWLANPGAPGRGYWHQSGPSFAAGPLFSEAVGKTTDSYRYVNLSDGGHFENLGIYEMVQRRCRYIVAVDGGQDGNYVFEDLGNAVRKIRIDLGIRVDLTLKFITPKLAKEQLLYCAVGEIFYGDVDDGAPTGRLIYVKPVITGDEPADVSNYGAAHPEFPHESTGDQFFSESQLESYRMLGNHAFEKIRGETSFADELDAAKRIEDFFVRVEKYTTIAPATSPESTSSALANSSAATTPHVS